MHGHGAGMGYMGSGPRVGPTDNFSLVTGPPPGLPSRTIALTVSSELLGFCFYCIVIFSFLCRALD